MERSPTPSWIAARWRALSARMTSLLRATGETADHLIAGKLSASHRPRMRQLKFFFHVLNAKERRTFALLAIAALVSGALTFRYLWHLIFVRVPAPGGMYTEGLICAPEYLNPLYAVGNDVDRDLTRLLFAGLVRFNERGEAEPDLAERVEVSPDGASYTVTLREGLAWSDGEPVTSDDVRFTIEAIKNPAYRSPLKSNFNAVSVDAPDARTGRLTLATTSAPFVESLTVGILPAHLWAAVEPKNALLTELNRKPVSVGPYRFESLAKDPNGNVRSYTFVRREEHVPFPPFIERITLKFYPDRDEAAQALKNRNIDGMALLSPDALTDALRIRRELTHHRLRVPQYTAIFLNPKASPLLESVKVRTALRYAIDRDGIIADVLRGEGTRVEGPFAPGALGYDASASTTPYDLAAARLLLDEEGWKLPDGDTVRVKGTPPQPLALTLTTVGQPEQYRAAELVQKQWQALGVKTDLQVVDPARVFELIRPRAYHALLVSEITGVDPDPYPFWHSSGLGEQGLNLANWSDRDADILLEDARKTVSRDVREEKYRAFQRILFREAPAIFLYRPSLAYVIDDAVQGVSLIGMANPSDRFAHIAQWYIETDWKLR